MKVIISPSELSGVLQAPASKSSMQRACAAALLRKGRTVIHSPGHSNDDKAAIDIIQKLGACVEHSTDALEVTSDGVNPVSLEVNCGESGLSIRMFTPIAALSTLPVRINGSGSLVQRPMDFFDQVLPQLGVRISSNAGRLPMDIQGPLQAQNITVDGSLSSQFLTGLLMAFSTAIRDQQISEPITITVNDLKSKPYIDLTLDVMQQFGLPVPVHTDHREFTFTSAGVLPQPSLVNYTVEGDWSGGAFLLVAGAIAGPITVRGLDPGSTQADKAILTALQRAHAGIAIDAKEIKLHPGHLHGFELDATDCPDLFPPLVALAAYCNGQSRIKGTGRLTHKESNRALTLQEEFGKMGVGIELSGDEMLINPPARLKGAATHSRHDHRIAMACAVAALRATGATEIAEAQAVNKSYPDFYSDLKSLGAQIDIQSLWQHLH